MDNNTDSKQIDDIVHMLDEFSDSDNKRVKISTSDTLSAGETRKTDILSKYDNTDPFVADIASIPKGKDKKYTDKKHPLNFDFFKLK